MLSFNVLSNTLLYGHVKQGGTCYTTLMICVEMLTGAVGKKIPKSKTDHCVDVFESWNLSTVCYVAVLATFSSKRNFCIKRIFSAL